MSFRSNPILFFSSERTSSIFCYTSSQLQSRNTQKVSFFRETILRTCNSPDSIISILPIPCQVFHGSHFLFFFPDNLFKRDLLFSVVGNTSDAIEFLLMKELSSNPQIPCLFLYIGKNHRLGILKVVNTCNF